MTMMESYPIHRCIFRNDAAALKELLSDERMRQLINESDNHGNTPIHLALMLNRHNCINVLLENNCDVFSRNNFGWNPMDEASMIGDIDVIEKMAKIKWNDYLDALVKPGGLLDQWNATTPNLYLKLKLKAKTTIPLLQKFGAKDIQQIYKKGNSFRLDTTLAGVDTRNIPKLIKGNISVLLRYEPSCGIYKVYLLDHKKKIYQEFFPNIPEWYLSNSLKSKVAANMLYKIFIDLSNFDVKATKGSILKKNTKTFTLEDGKSYKCAHYKGKKASVIIRKRNDEAMIGECESIIKEEVKEEDLSKSKKSKEGKLGKGSSFISHHSSSKSSNDSDDESDSDSDSDDSDDDSDTEISNKSNGDKPLPDFLGNIYGKKGSKDENGSGKQDPNKTVIYTVNKNGESKTFEKETTMEDTLDWEQAYHDKYAQNSDLMLNLMGGNSSNNKVKRLNHMEIEKLNLKKLTEEEYFAPSSTGDLHMGRIMNITEMKKTYKHKIKFWMAKESSHFPVSAYDIKPIFEYAMMIVLDQIKTNRGANDMDRKTYEYITKTLLNRIQDKHSFPVKTSIPIYPSIAFQITFLNASKDIKNLPDELFEIPKDYKQGNVFFEHIQKK